MFKKKSKNNVKSEIETVEILDTEKTELETESVESVKDTEASAADKVAELENELESEPMLNCNEIIITDDIAKWKECLGLRGTSGKLYKATWKEVDGKIIIFK